MKLTRSIDFPHYSNPKTPKLSEFNITTTSINSNYIHDMSRNTKKTSKEKKRKILSHNSFNDETYKGFDNLTIQKIKKKNNRDKSRNSKLTPAKYIKPLYYMLNNQIKAINKQFSGYRNNRFFINFNYNIFSSFKNGDNSMIKTISNNPKEANNNSIFSSYMKQFQNNNKNNIKRKQNCSFDDRTKNIRFNNFINYSQDNNETINSKITLLQACFRSFLIRNKFYKNLKENCTNEKYSETISKLIKNYFNKLNSIKNENNNLKSRNKKDNFNFNQTYYNSSYINPSLENINKTLVKCQIENFIIRPKKKKSHNKYDNTNLYLIKKQKDLLEKEKEIFIKEKKMDELKIKELMEENNKLKKKNIIFEKNKSNFEKLKEENEILIEKLKNFEERSKECDIIENKYKNLLDQNESLYQENLKLNEQIQDNIKNLMEINKKNQEKIKLYEESMNDQESLINENQRLNKLNKQMENKIEQLTKENNEFKEKTKENEINDQDDIKNSDTKKINIKQEKEKLIEENKKISAKNEELQNLVEEMKKKIAKISKAYKFTNKYISENANNQSREKSRISTPQELNEENTKKNDEDKDNSYHYKGELYLKRIRERKPIDSEKLAKEEKMKNLLRNRIKEMKDDLHKCFMRFYYNGIFVQMQKRKSEVPTTKVVKSRRFSELINKFSSGANNQNKKFEKIDERSIKRLKTKSYDDKTNNNNVKNENNIINEEKDE